MQERKQHLSAHCPLGLFGIGIGKWNKTTIQVVLVNICKISHFFFSLSEQHGAVSELRGEHHSHGCHRQRCAWTRHNERRNILVKFIWIYICKGNVVFSHAFISSCLDYCSSVHSMWRSQHCLVIQAQRFLTGTEKVTSPFISLTSLATIEIQFVLF